MKPPIPAARNRLGPTATCRPMRHVRGFTLIELIMVLVMLGILSTGARALFLARSEMAGALVQDQLILSVRLAQQNALAKSRSAGVTHTMSSLGDDYRLNIFHSSFQDIREIEGQETTVTVSTSALTGSCTAVTGTLPHTLLFDSQGRTTATRYCIGGSREYSVCVSGEGYAYEGACDP